MDSTLAANIVAYCAQVACVVAAGSLLPLVLRLDAPSMHYGYWRALLALCLALPFLQGRHVLSEQTTVITPVPWTVSIASTPAAGAAATGTSVDWLLVAAVVLAAGVLVRLTWLAVSLLHLRRLRSAGAMAPPCEERDALQRALGIRAEIRYVEELRQPVTFGVRWPVVLLPTGMLQQPPGIQRAVLCHELVHVERRDWAWVLVEEIVRAVLWFHPAIWWVVSRVQLAREEVVDLQAVRITGGRRPYIEALMAFADAPPLAQAAAFSRRRHLFRRIVLLSKDTAVSSTRLLTWAAALALVLAAGSWRAVTAFPLLQSSATDSRGEPGPLERIAAPITPENPIPRSSRDQRDHDGRVAGAEPPPPPSAAADAALPAPRRADTPRTGLEGVDELTRRLQQRASPPAAPSARGETTLGIPADQSPAASTAAPPEAASSPAPLPAPPEGTVAASPPSAPAEPIRVGGNIATPRKIKDVRPLYPPIAASARVSGTVILEATIGVDGVVENARVLRSIPLLDQAALDAVRQWQFTQTFLNGVPTRVVMSVTVSFTLD